MTDCIVCGNQIASHREIAGRFTCSFECSRNLYEDAYKIKQRIMEKKKKIKERRNDK